MENTTIEKQETVAKIMELIDGGESFYELALELAFSQKLYKEVYEQMEKHEDWRKYTKISIMFLNKSMWFLQLERVVRKMPLLNCMFKNTKIDSKTILVKRTDCKICLPF